MEWREPQQRQQRGPRVYESILAELSERPGEWAIIHRFKDSGSARSTAWQLRQGKVAGDYDPSTFEFTVRGTELYARYIGQRASST